MDFLPNVILCLNFLPSQFPWLEIKKCFKKGHIVSISNWIRTVKKLSIELRVTLWGLTSHKENEQCYRLICPTMATSALGIIKTYFLWIPQIHLFLAAWQLIPLLTYFFKRVQAISVLSVFTYWANIALYWKFYDWCLISYFMFLGLSSQFMDPLLRFANNPVSESGLPPCSWTTTE